MPPLFWALLFLRMSCFVTTACNKSPLLQVKIYQSRLQPSNASGLVPWKHISQTAVPNAKALSIESVKPMESRKEDGQPKEKQYCSVLHVTQTQDSPQMHLLQPMSLLLTKLQMPVPLLPMFPQSLLLQSQGTRVDVPRALTRNQKDPKRLPERKPPTTSLSKLIACRGWKGRRDSTVRNESDWPMARASEL